MSVLKLDAIADTSFVVGMAMATESKHADCLSVYREFRHIGLPEAAYAEIAFMLTREGGTAATARFFGNLSTSKFRAIRLEAVDYFRIGELLGKYNDSHIDFVDIVIVALAERLRVKRILTLDQRDFQIIRPAHIDYFELLP
ncbi:MAG: PIN domain-containing protein [Anaerolineae bacterium]